MTITILLKTGQKLVCGDSKHTLDEAIKRIMRGHPVSGKTGIVWNTGDGKAIDIPPESIQRIY